METQFMICDPKYPEGEIDYYLIKFRTQILKKFSRGRKALELGCATGFSTYLLCELFDDITVIEISESYIQIAEAFLTEKNCSQPVKFIKGDWRNIDKFLQNDRFTDIVWFQGIESLHKEDVLEVFKKLPNFMGEKARLHLVSSNKFSLHRRLGFYMGVIDNYDELSQKDMTLWDKKWLGDVYTLTKLFELAGYRVLHVEPYFLKPFPDRYSKNLPEELIWGLFELGKELPLYCAEIYICGRVKDECADQAY